ncbi:ImmA/IrrE family metallo-endopeptidase [Hydrogenophaga sp.]
MFKAKDVLDTHWDGNLPIQPRSLAQAMGVQVFGVPNLDVSGMIELNNGKPLITFNSSDAPVRQRFTIAHEIGHYALGHLGAGTTKFRDPASHFSSSTHKVEEREANRFAANLLMPAGALMFAIERHGMNSIDNLAELFGVSQVAMQYRLENLGLIDARAW